MSKWCTVNERGLEEGIFRSYHDTDSCTKIYCEAMMKDGTIFGEYRQFDFCGNIVEHEYIVDGEIKVFLLKVPITKEDKLLLTLKYGGEWLPDEQTI